MVQWLKWWIIGLVAMSTTEASKRQSPIDLLPMTPVRNDGQIVLRLGKANGKLIHKGKTAQVDWNGGSQLSLNGHNYKPLQLHFHSASDHLLNGHQFPLEMHIVHQSVTDKNQLAVVGFFFEISTHKNPFLDQFFPALKTLQAEVSSLDVGVIHTKLLNVQKGARFYRYSGSLTTPPYSENVEWVVAAQPQPISEAQLKIYLQKFPDATYRKPQPLHGREVVLVEL